MPVVSVQLVMRHLTLAFLLAGCAAPAPPPQVVDTGCDWTRPIRVSQDDHFTLQTAREILAHNETWKVRCGG